MARSYASSITRQREHLQGRVDSLQRTLLALADPPAVVLTSSRDAAELESCADDCGACGFVPKAELSREAIEELLP